MLIYDNCEIVFAIAMVSIAFVSTGVICFCAYDAVDFSLLLVESSSSRQYYFKQFLHIPKIYASYSKSVCT